MKILLLSQLGSLIILLFLYSNADTQFQGETLQRRRLNTRWWKKIAIFDSLCRLFRKRNEIMVSMELSEEVIGDG